MAEIAVKTKKTKTKGQGNTASLHQKKASPLDHVEEGLCGETQSFFCYYDVSSDNAKEDEVENEENRE